MNHDLKGVPVSEEEVAVDLGFANVSEMRRWETECGQKVAVIEEKLRSASFDRDNFRWHGLRMQALLEKVEKYLRSETDVSRDELLLAVGVVLGKEVDWDHKLGDWFSMEVVGATRKEKP